MFDHFKSWGIIPSVKPSDSDHGLVVSCIAKAFCFVGRSPWLLPPGRCFPSKHVGSTNKAHIARLKRLRNLLKVCLSLLIWGPPILLKEELADSAEKRWVFVRHMRRDRLFGVPWLCLKEGVPACMDVYCSDFRKRFAKL